MGRQCQQHNILAEPPLAPPTPGGAAEPARSGEKTSGRSRVTSREVAQSCAALAPTSATRSYALAPARSMYEVVVILHKEKANSKLVRWANPRPEPTRLPTALRSTCSSIPFCVLCVVQGFLLESEYEGDNGHPRMSWINPTSAANSVLVKGDILLEINGKPAKSHTQAARAIAAIKGDVVLKLLAEKPRGGMTTIEAIEASGGVNAGETATKIQSWVRGHQSRKAMLLPEGVQVSEGSKKPPPGMPPHAEQEANVTTEAEQDAAAAKVRWMKNGRHSRKKMDSAPDASPANQEAAGSTSDTERDVAKMQSLTRGRHSPSRKKMGSAPTPPAAEKEAAVATDAERDAAAAKVQSLTRGRHSRKKMDSARHSRKKSVSTPDAPPAEQEEMGSDELEAVAQDGSKHRRRRSVEQEEMGTDELEAAAQDGSKHRRRRSVKALEEHRHHHRTKPEDFGAEVQLAELSLAEASTPNRHKHRRRSTRKREELGGEAEGAEEARE